MLYSVVGHRHTYEIEQELTSVAHRSVRVHFTRSDQARFVSAAAVLAGKIDPRVLERKLVLIGVTALGLSDYQATPVADRMAGVVPA